MIAAYWIAVFLFGVLFGAVCGVAFAVRESRRDFEDRLRLALRYGPRGDC